MVLERWLIGSQWRTGCSFRRSGFDSQHIPSVTPAPDIHAQTCIRENTHLQKSVTKFRYDLLSSQLESAVDNDHDQTLFALTVSLTWVWCG